MRSWETLPKADAAEFLRRVADKKHSILFEPSICEVFRLPLAFYDGYYLYRISNHYTVPYILLDYLSNGEDFYYMDGSETPIHNLNIKGALNLNKRNAFDYLDLFISYVYEHGNSLEFRGKFESSDVTFDEKRQAYLIKTPLNYQGQDVEGTTEVLEEGVIVVKKPLEVDFLKELEPNADIGYTHPREKQIIEDTKTLLAGTEKGRELLKIIDQTKPEFRVLSSPNYQGFVTNSRVVYITMPAAEQTAKYTQAVMLAGALRGVKQVADGYLNPHPVADEKIYGDIVVGKNLDMLLEMCKMVVELENMNTPEGFEVLKLMGFEELYNGVKSGMNEDALMDLYEKALENQEIMSWKKK